MTDHYNHMVEHKYRRQRFEDAVERDRLIREYRSRPGIGINLKHSIIRLVTSIRMPRVRTKPVPRRIHETASTS